MKRTYLDSELILNPNGSVYHIAVRPENVADTVIVVGDQDRVAEISKYFDKIEFKVQHREFVTHTGTIGNKRITALSTGIGCDNIDIVVNELDAAVNINLETRQANDKLRKLDIIRLGTSGALRSDIPVDTFVMSSHGLGFDGLLHYYNVPENLYEQGMTDAFMKHTNWKDRRANPYIVKASEELINKIGKNGFTLGITATAHGFFGPQGRELRLPLAFPDLNDKLATFEHDNYTVTNFEMETSALYGLGKALGHNCVTVCNIIANRILKQYSKDPKTSIDNLIKLLLERLTK